MTEAQRRAVEFIRADDWAAAHDLVQADDSELGAFLHGLVHRLEGDESNARYWLRRAGALGREYGTMDLSAALDAVPPKLP